MRAAPTILGIDPGFAITGFGVIQSDGNKLIHVAHGCIRTPAGMPHAERLEHLYTELSALIKQYAPHRCAVEQLFFYTNAKTALAVGEGRGVVLLCARQARLPIAEYTPLQVKQAVSAYGKADKQQVQKMVKLLLGLKEVPKPDDAADALAVAICGAHAYSNSHTRIV